MGVHDTDKYAEVKALLGIPQDEPIFIFRAQDRLMEDALLDYSGNYIKEVTATGNRRDLTSEQRKFVVEVERCADEVYDWQQVNDDKVKIPD